MMNDITQGIVNTALGKFDETRFESASANISQETYQEIEEKAQDFEAVFMTQMMQHMFSGIETDELFGGGAGEEIMKTLLFDEYGKSIAQAGGVGISDQIQNELIKLQSAQH